MNRKHLGIKYGSLVHFFCDDGYITAAGVEGESLFLRKGDEKTLDGDPMPPLSFETSVFRLVAPSHLPAAAAEAALDNESGGAQNAAGKENGENGEARGALSMEHSGRADTEAEVTFGMTFTLLHDITQMQVAVLPSKSSDLDPGCVRVVLVPPGEVAPAYCEFVFVSRYKVHDEGDPVCRGDGVLIRLAGHPTFLHVTSLAVDAEDTSEADAGPVDHTASFTRNSYSDLFQLSPRAAFGPQHSSVKATESLEVNGSGERGIMFVVERYDMDHDRANYQRSLHHIIRPCVQAGVPVALFHSERESFFASSYAAPRAVAPVGEVEWIPGDKKWDAAEPVPLPMRKKNYAVEGIETARGVARREEPNVCKGARKKKESFSAASGGSIPLLVAGDEAQEGKVTSCTTLWVIESEDPRVGGAVRLASQRYRLRQACSNTYLAVSGPAVDAFFDDADGQLDASIEDVTGKNTANAAGEEEAVNGTEQQGETGATEMESERATKLCMIPPPQSRRDLQRTLFTIAPMFASESEYLIEGDCLLLQNVLTKLYVCAQEMDDRLFLQWQPSVCDTVVVRLVPWSTQYDVFFVHSRCEQLRKYRDAFQLLIKEQLSQGAVQDSKDSQERKGQSKVEQGAREFVEDDEVRKSFIRPSLSHMPKHFASFDSFGNENTLRFNEGSRNSNDNVFRPAYADLFPIIAHCQGALAELIRFCSSSPEQNVFRRDGIPIPARQRAMFDLHVHHLIFEVILAPFVRLCGIGDLAGGGFSNWNASASLPALPHCGGVVALPDVLLDEHGELHTVCRLGFRLLRQMLRRAPSFKLGFEKYISHFLALDGYRFSVMDFLTELFADNTTIGISEVKCVVDHVVAGLRVRMRSSYIELLSAMCTVGFCGVPARQANVCAQLLTQTANGLLPQFTADAAGCWVIALPPSAAPEAANDILADASSQRARFVIATVELLARLCYDGCSPMCCEAVAQVFPADAALAALRTFVWTGAEVTGAVSVLDTLRAHVLRLSLHCHMERNIGDVAAQLCTGTVLFGASRLRHRLLSHDANADNPMHMDPSRRSDYEINSESSTHADIVEEAVKVVTLQILHANSSFQLANQGRNRLIRASVYVWMRLASSRRYTDTETRELVPLLLSLLNVAQDVVDESTSRVAALKFTRLEATEISMTVMQVRELACRTLRFILDNAAHRGADEIIVYLHNAFVGDSLAPFYRPPFSESANVASVRVHDESSGEGGYAALSQEKHVHFGALDDKSLAKDNKHELEWTQMQGQQEKNLQASSSCRGSASGEREPLLQVSAVAPPPSNAKSLGPGGYQSINDDAVVGESGHNKWVPVDSRTRVYDEGDINAERGGGGTKQEEEMQVIPIAPKSSPIDPDDVVEYLRRVCTGITRLLYVQDLIPRLMDLTCCGNSRLTAQAMELLVALCSLRRAVAQRVLLIHTLPATEVVRDFDDFHDVTVRVLRLIGPHGTDGNAAAVDSATALAVSSIAGAPSDETETETEMDATSDTGDAGGTETSGIAPKAAEQHGVLATLGKHDSRSKEEHKSGDESEEGSRKSKIKRGLWAKTAAAARVLSYSHAVRERRRALGLSASSHISMRAVVRAELCAHWRLHVPLLRLQSSGGLDPQTDAFVSWMRFFYLFTRSRDCARLLSTHIGTFLALLGVRESCDVPCLHVVLAILGTVADPTPHLTPKLLAAFAAYVDREAAGTFPDDDFVRALSINIFARPVVYGAARRRMLVLMLRGKTALRAVSCPREKPSPLDVLFTTALVQLLCDICGASMSAIAIGQRALSVNDACALINEYGTRCSPLSRKRLSRRFPCGFALFGAYLSALVALHMAVVEERGAIAERVEWMANDEWWRVVQLIASLFHDAVERIDADANAGCAENVGLRVLKRYRSVWFVTIPVALLTFMTKNFDDGAYYRRREIVGPIFKAMCANMASFVTRVITHAAALDLHVRDVAHYRKLVQLIFSRVRGFAGLYVIASALDTAQGIMHKWTIAHPCSAGYHAQGHDSNDKNDNDDDDSDSDNVNSLVMGAERQEMSALGVTPGMSRLLKGKGGRALYLSGARAKCKDVEEVRTALSSFVQEDVLIPLKDSAAGHTEPAGILNAQLRRCAELSSVRDIVTNMLNGIYKQDFTPVTCVGLFNALHNAVRTAFNDSEDECNSKNDEHHDIGMDNKSDYSIGAICDGNEGYVMQVTLSDLGAMRVAASAVAIDDAVLTYSAVQLGVALLDGGNTRVQALVLDYFETQQEAFFHDVRSVLHRAQEWVRRLNREHQLTLVELGSVLTSVANTHQFTSMLLAQANSSLYSGSSNRSAKQSVMGWDCELRSFRTQMFSALLRLLQLFCEGHNAEMQNYIRSQHDNFHSANILHEVMCFLMSLAEVVHPSAHGIIVQVFELLTELCQGPCHSNQAALLTYDVCSCICRILDVMHRQTMTAASNSLTHDGGGGTLLVHQLLSQQEMGLLRISISTHLLSLIEGCRSHTVFERILSQIPVEYIERELATAPPELVNQMIDDEEIEDDPILAAAYNWLIFINTVRPFADEVYRRHIDRILRRNATLSSRLGCIEVRRDDGLLEKVFFRIPLICRGLTQPIKDGLLWNVNRASRVGKLSDFLHRSDNLIFEVEQAHTFQKWVIRWTRFCIRNSEMTTGGILMENKQEGSSMNHAITRVKQFYNKSIAPLIFSYYIRSYERYSVIVALLVNILIIFFAGIAQLDPMATFEYFTLTALCVLQFALSCVTLGMETFIFFPVSLYVEYRKKQLLSGTAKIDATMKEVLNGLTKLEIVRLFCTSFTVLFRVFLVVSAALSVLFSHYFAAAHLLLVVYKTPTLCTYITAITQNGKQLLLSALLGIVVLYFFAIVGFHAFPYAFGGDKDTGENCTTLLRCFAFILWQGLRQGGGVGDVMESESWTSSHLLARVSYDLFFFALVNVIFLNIMFGIIIDTFGELRDSKRERDQDMHTTCFICGLEADVLERGRVGGFRAHVREEHNMWMYLYFMHYLRRKDPVDFTGQESYVDAKIRRGDLSFFPEGESIAIAEAQAEAEAGAGADHRPDGEKEADEDPPESRAVAKALKDLTVVKEALSAFVRDAGADAAKIKAMLQQMEIANRSERKSSWDGSGVREGGSEMRLRPQSVLGATSFAPSEHNASRMFSAAKND